MTHNTYEPMPISDADVAHLEMLGKEAATFLADRSGPSRSQRVIVADFEYEYDLSAFKRYQIAEDDPTEGYVRWPFHRVVAGSWCVLTLSPELDRPVVTNVEAITNRPEAAIAEEFFVLCSAFQDARIVSWGGENKDFACLRRTAMEHGIALPTQLRDGAPFSRSRLDLANAMRGLGHYVHLPELAAALGVPAKPIPSRDIGLAVKHGQWDHVEAQVVADVCTIAQVAWRYFLAVGAASGLPGAGDEAIVAALSERFPENSWLSRMADPRQLAA